jgi:hypothetical protein
MIWISQDEIPSAPPRLIKGMHALQRMVEGFCPPPDSLPLLLTPDIPSGAVAAGVWPAVPRRIPPQQVV